MSETLARCKIRWANTQILIPISDDHDFAPFYQVVLAATYRSLRLDPGDTVLDAGANTGVFTALAAKQVGPSGLVIAVEADAENFYKLRRTIQLNDLTNVCPFHRALWSSSGFELSLEGSGLMTSVHRDNPIAGQDTSRASRTALSITVDEILRGLDLARIDKVKMDIEGSEAEVIGAPASRGIVRAREVIMEVHGDRTRADVTTFLLANGFETARTIEGSEDIVALAQGILTHPIVSAKMELWNRFRTTSRLLKSILPSQQGASNRVATIHFAKTSGSDNVPTLEH